MNSKSANLPVTESVAETVVAVASVPAVADGVEPRVRILRTISELEELRTVWSAWGGHKDSDIDVLLVLLQSREEILKPHVIVIYRNGEPDAMLIGRLERRRIDHKVGYLSLFKTRARIMTFQCGGLRGNPSDANCREIILSIMNSLESSEADMAWLNNPSTDSFLYKRALSLPSWLSRDYSPVPRPHHLMRLPGSIEEVYLGLSSKHRKHLRSEAKKIESKFDGRLKIRCFREDSELEIAISLIEEIARKTYQRGLGVGLDISPRAHHLLHLLQARKGWLRVYVLFDADTPVVFWIGAVYGGWFYSEGTGYDPDYGDFSPGTFLLVKMINDFCEEGLQGIDFGLGDAMYKRRFGNQSFEAAAVHLFAPGVKGFLLKAMHTITSAVANTLKNMLARTKMLPKVKRFWRDRLAQTNTSN